MTEAAPDPTGTDEDAEKNVPLSDTIISKLEADLGFSEADRKTVEKLFSKTEVNSQSWETLLARIADRKEEAS